jgi:aspartate/methionine/tyrosine aminotransferase
MADMLSDKPFVQEFLYTSKQRLENSYQICTSVLDDCRIPFVQAHAAMFVWIDLSSLLSSSSSSWSEEGRLAKLFVNHGRIVMTPGQSQHGSKPGMFRICYAYVSSEVLQIGMQRFRHIVLKLQERGGLGDWVDNDEEWRDVIH